METVRHRHAGSAGFPSQGSQGSHTANRHFGAVRPGAQLALFPRKPGRCLPQLPGHSPHLWTENSILTCVPARRVVSLSLPRTRLPGPCYQCGRSLTHRGRQSLIVWTRPPESDLDTYVEIRSLLFTFPLTMDVKEKQNKTSTYSQFSATTEENALINNIDTRLRTVLKRL